MFMVNFSVEEFWNVKGLIVYKLDLGHMESSVL
jgi:hypothetical protein